MFRTARLIFWLKIINNKKQKMENTMYRDYLLELEDCIRKTQILKGTEKLADWESAFEQVVTCFMKTKRETKQLFFIGNGGSSAIASHMTADFMKNGGMRTVSLYDNALTTCMGNDYGYEYVFSRPMKFWVKEGDLVVAISSSGNSPNICNAIKAAKGKGAEVVTFTGFAPDNKSKAMGDINVYVPCSKYGIVESIHNLILQQVVDLIMERDGVKT